MSFIEKTTEECDCCSDEMVMYYIPLPQGAVTFGFPNGFVLHIGEDELQTLYLAIKEHLTGLHDVHPID